MDFANVKHLTIGNRNAVRVSVGGSVVWKGLPIGYKRLDYIETTGTQYIDTGFVPDQDTRIVCEFMYFKDSNIYGSRDTTGKSGFALRVISTKWQAQYNGDLAGTISSDATNWHIADQNKNVFTLDNVKLHTFTYGEFESPYPITIGGILANSNGVTKMNYGSSKYRSFQIYDDGSLVRDLIPCKNPNGNIGMYDTLNAVFYGNAGTGAFVAGAEL